MRSSPIKTTFKNNHIVRRRAVFTALRPIMQDETLYRCLWLWEKQYSNGQSMRLRNFIAEIVECNLFQGNAHEAYKNLVQCFMQDPSLLAPDPYQDMLKHQDSLQHDSSAAQDDTPNSIKRPRETVVFEAVMNEFMNSLDKHDSYGINAIAQNIRNNSQDMDLTSHQKQELLNWINTRGNKPLNLAFSLSQMSTIINSTYVTACDLVGPVKSDHYLSHAIEIAERLPEALDFKPHNLL
jgi:hypothetical protein